MNGRGGDGDIGEACRKTRGSDITGQSSSDTGDLRSQGQNPIAVKIDDGVQPLGQSGGFSVRLSPLGEDDPSLNLGNRHDGQKKIIRPRLQPSQNRDIAALTAGRGFRNDIGVEKITLHTGKSRNGVSSLAGKSSGSSGADVSRRAKDGTWLSRCHSR